MKILYSNITVREGQKLEGIAVEDYENDDWYILNIAPVGENVGSLGGLLSGKWDIKTVLSIARKYDTRSDFFKYDTNAYRACFRFKLFDQIDWFKDIETLKFWTKEEVIKASKKYKSKRSFHINCPDGYNAARRNNWWDEIPWVLHKKHIYTKEEILEIAQNCKHKSDFKKKNPSAWNAARRNGWLSDIDWFEPQYVPLDDNLVIRVAMRYRNRTEFKKHSTRCYNYAVEHNLLDSIPGMELKIIPISSYSREEVFNEARKYPNRSTFSKNSSGFYRAAIANNWLEEMDFFPDPPKRYSNEEIYEVAKEFSTSKEFSNQMHNIYIIALERDMFEQFTWMDKSSMRSLQKHLTNEEVINLSKECKTKSSFKKKYPSAFRIAEEENLFQYMSLKEPKVNIIWDYDTFVKYASTCETKTEFKTKYQRGYCIALKNGWLDTINFKELCKPKKYFATDTKNRVFEIAKKYKSATEFNKNETVAWRIARDNDWLDELFPNRRKTRREPYTLEELIKIVKEQYPLRKDFEKKCKKGYKEAKENNWMDLLPFNEIRKPRNYWNKDNVFKESLGCTTRQEFRNKNATAYQVALINNWLDEMTWLGEPPRRWTFCSVLKESKKFKSRIEFARQMPGCYQVALENGWLELFTWLKPQKYSQKYKELYNTASQTPTDATESSNALF